MSFRWVFAALITCAAAASGQAVTSPPAIDTLMKRFVVVKNSLAFAPVPDRFGRGREPQPDMGQLCRIAVPEVFTYIGGQRFILQSVADAEQHFFVRADSLKNVSELIWFQVEVGIPGRSGGYTYAADSVHRFAGLNWRLDLRSTFGFIPPPGSDGAAMRAFVAGKGYRLQPMAPRLRLVYLPTPGGLQEFMIIHLTAARVAGADTSFESSFARARNRFLVTMCP
jgi:hypothetical protein